MKKPVQAKTSLFVIALLLLLPVTAPGAYADATDLKAWESWILDKHPDSSCPWQMSHENQRLCSWPGKLTLALSAKGVDFTFNVAVYSDEALIQIPGDNKYWPDSVSVGGKPAPIVEKNNNPHVSLSRGTYDLKGNIRWEQKPTSLTIPGPVALISLFESGKELVVDRRSNRIIFSQNQIDASSRKRDSLTVEVYRLLSDGVPLTLETRLKLVVSGKPREIKIGRVALSGTEVMSLNARLPARIEKDGDIRIQVIAGEHYIRVLSRFLTNIDSIETKRQGEPWPVTEYISFISNTNIRQSKLSGAISVDTTQISIPEEWMGLPTYRMDDTTRLQIDTAFRGDHSPLVNQLRIKRDLWLDFEGGAMTALEAVNGRMYRDWRLNARPDTHIGRATVEDQPVLITQDKGPQGTGLQGIEIRSPDINLSAVTRIQNPRAFSAVGWDARVDNYQATLHLPPGWRVLHASGVDDIQGTWISGWDLWDIFLILIMVAATKKMFGLYPAILAGCALIISYHESGAPLLYFPLLLLVLALLTVLTGRWKQVISIAGTGLSALLVLAMITFAVLSFRVAIYPTLEKDQLYRYQTASAMELRRSDSKFAVDQVMAPAESVLKREVLMEEVIVTASSARDNLYQVYENDRLQTGPGLPTWLWNRINFRSSSPVSADQNMSIIYCPPWITGLWRIASVFLMGGFAALLILRLSQLVSFKSGSNKGGGPGSSPDGNNLQDSSTDVTVESTLNRNAVSGLMILVTSLALLVPQTAGASDFPPRYMLDDLESRLLKAPQCLPGCASINNGRLITDGPTLRLMFDVYADADIALPVPTGREGWKLDRITIDGTGEASATVNNNQTLILVKKGHHKIVLSGNIQGDQASISFPLPIHNFSVVSEHWLVEGLVDDRIPSKTLSLRSKAKTQQADEDTLIADPVSPFVFVHREFLLGKRWTMTTRVQRVAPIQAPMAVSIPLLPFENVLSDTLNIQQGKAQLQFDHNQQEIFWQSTLNPMETMRLTAANDPGYMETWRFIPSSLWRISYSGIPAMKEAGDISSLQPHWKPWPDETLTINISRPEGLQGPTQTVEEVVLNYKAGKDLQTSRLVIDIRSSLGDDYTVILPEAAEVLSLILDGNTLNLPPGNTVTVPLQPGLQKLTIEFQQHRDLNLFNTTPDIKLPGNVTNITIRYELPRDRWPLYLTGPDIGPAMLYWGVLCVIILGAIILSQLAQKLSLDIPVTLMGWLLLGLGLSTVNSYGVLIIAIFFFLMALRRQHLDPQVLGRRTFNGIQIIILLWTIITALALVAAIPMGLLSDPDMKVVGNGSHAHLYNFYQDRMDAESFPSAHVFSVSMLTYRIAMLLWSLWLATRLIQWAQWWWQAYSARVVWVSKT